jgi:hypothetical protein
VSFGFLADGRGWPLRLQSDASSGAMQQQHCPTPAVVKQRPAVPSMQSSQQYVRGRDGLDLHGREDIEGAQQ